MCKRGNCQAGRPLHEGCNWKLASSRMTGGKLATGTSRLMNDRQQVSCQTAADRPVDRSQMVANCWQPAKQQHQYTAEDNGQ